MAASQENESEILLGNKQLLAVFAIVALLLAIAFTGGYMLGRNSAEKKTLTADSQTPAENSSALVPHTVIPDDSSTKAEPLASKSEPDKLEAPPPSREEAKATTPEPTVKPKHVVDKTGTAPLGAHVAEGAPHPGQTYVQVAALTHTEAVAMADVLKKQNFAARIAPKPGSTTVYRVLVGPTRDAAEITATRDALRKIGFREVIVQRY